MDFDLTHEQRLLSTMLDRALADQKDHVCTWHTLAELGALGASLPEDHGGSGGGGVETMIVMQSLGRAASPAPYLSGMVMAANAIAASGSYAQQAAILPGLIDGTTRVAFAHAEPNSRYRLAHVTASATRAAGSYIIRGQKGLIAQGQNADCFIVSARIDGATSQQQGLTLFLVDANSPGLDAQILTTQDGHGAVMLTLAGVHIKADDVLGTSGEAWPIIAQIHDRAIAAICAEALGAMEEACRLTLDYLGTRQQFGQKIGSFQALQHRAVDMFVALELARSMVMYAAVMADDPDPVARARAMSAVKIRVARSARLIAQEAIQLHGAIGLTEEYALAQHARRLAMIEMQFGDIDYHAGRLAA